MSTKSPFLVLAFALMTGAVACTGDDTYPVVGTIDAAVTSCQLTSASECVLFKNIPPGVSAVSLCPTGALGGSCPNANLLGCCTTGTSPSSYSQEICYYPAPAAPRRKAGPRLARTEDRRPPVRRLARTRAPVHRARGSGRRPPEASSSTRYSSLSARGIGVVERTRTPEVVRRSSRT